MVIEVALIEREVEDGHYCKAGPVDAPYRIVSVEHGPLARDAFSSGEGFMVTALGMAERMTAGTRLELEPVDAHDVPWDAIVWTLTGAVTVLA